MNRFEAVLAATLVGALLLYAGVSYAESRDTQPSAADSIPDAETFDQKTVLGEIEAFFGKGSKGVGELVEKSFADFGRPNAYIRGEEAGGALIFGLRYGHGTLVTKSGLKRDVYWQGPSIGFDTGGNASKTFMLIYNLRNIDELFQRYPGVDGSIYFIGGVGMNYNRSEDLTIAPIRLGVGWRLGINAGYLKITREGTIIPF